MAIVHRDRNNVINFGHYPGWEVGEQLSAAGISDFSVHVGYMAIFLFCLGGGGVGSLVDSRRRLVAAAAFNGLVPRVWHAVDNLPRYCQRTTN